MKFIKVEVDEFGIEEIYINWFAVMVVGVLLIGIFYNWGIKQGRAEERYEMLTSSTCERCEYRVD